MVYLVEAADDICYNIIDLEDAHRLKILSYQEVEDLLVPLSYSASLTDRLKEIEDPDARIALLRARSIGAMVKACSEVFFREQESLLNGDFNISLTDALPDELGLAWAKIEEVSVRKIYNYSSVAQIEVAGYKVIGGLLEEFVPAYLKNESKYHKKIVELIPSQFLTTNADAYSKILSVLDFVSGMTDIYAVELYRKIKGISFPTIS